MIYTKDRISGTQIYAGLRANMTICGYVEQCLYASTKAVLCLNLLYLFFKDACGAPIL